MAQFVHDYRTENDVGDFRRLPACDQARLLLTKERNTGVRIRKKGHSIGSRSSKSPCDARRSPGIEPATWSKKPSGQPFSSTGDPAATGVTVTTTATSTSAMSTSTLKFSLPSFVVCARVSIILLVIPTMYWNWSGRSSERRESGGRSAAFALRRWYSPRPGLTAKTECFFGRG